MRLFLGYPNPGSQGFRIFTTMEKTITARIPDSLLKKAEQIILEGGAVNLDSLLIEALKRLLDTKTYALEKRFVEEDLNWGLNGTD